MHLADLGKVQMRLSTYQKRFDEAVNVAKDALSLFNNPCVNISGGKDSIALLAVVAEAALQLKRTAMAWIHISDASFPGTLETAQTACDLFSVPLLVYNNPTSAFSADFSIEHKKFGKTGAFFNSIKENVESNRFDLVFIGNRIEESVRRRKACLSHGYLYSTTVPTRHYCCTPIMRFKVEDVAATIEKYRLPWHPIYSKWHDRSFDKIRLGYVTATDLMELGTVVFLRVNYPDIYNKLAIANPNIKGYV